MNSLHPLTGIFPSWVTWLWAAAISCGLLVKVLLCGNPLCVYPSSFWQQPLVLSLSREWTMEWGGREWRANIGNLIIRRPYQTCYTDYGLSMSNTWAIIRGLVRNAEPQAPPQTCWVISCILIKPLGQLLWTLRFEKPCIRYDTRGVSYVLSDRGAESDRTVGPHNLSHSGGPALPLGFWHVLNISNNFIVRHLWSIIFFTDSSHLNCETSIMSIHFLSPAAFNELKTNFDFSRL